MNQHQIQSYIDKIKLTISQRIALPDQDLSQYFSVLNQLNDLKARPNKTILDRIYNNLKLEKRATYFAPGLPEKAKATLPTSLGDTEVVFQEHIAEKAGKHFDIRIHKNGIAHSWAIRSLPAPGQRVLAVHQPDHDPEYSSFEGEIKSGYGKGKVSVVGKGRGEILKAEPNKISFVIFDGKTNHRLTLVHTSGDQWLLVNHTPTSKTRPDIPRTKPKLKIIKEVNTNNKEEILAPKLDGAHTVFVLRKNKPAEAYSYRPSKGSYGLSDYTYKSDLYKQMVPKDIGNTIVRGETFAVDTKNIVQPSQITSGILNSTTPNARKSLFKLKHIIFDIDRFKGKDVSKEPYRDKLNYLKQIQQEIPLLQLPPLAKTKAQKDNLLTSVKSGKNYLTQEGVVIYNLNEAIPKKHKLIDDYDVYITDIFEGTGKYKNKAAGGFKYALQFNGKEVGRVGTGFSDEQRIDMYQHPEKYVGSIAKIKSQNQYASGAFRMPVFKEIRSEQFPERTH